MGTKGGREFNIPCDGFTFVEVNDRRLAVSAFPGVLQSSRNFDVTIVAHADSPKHFVARINRRTVCDCNRVNEDIWNRENRERGCASVVFSRLLDKGGCAERIDLCCDLVLPNRQRTEVTGGQGVTPFCLRITCACESDSERSRGHQASIAIRNFQPHWDFRGTAAVGTGESARKNPWPFECPFFDANTHLTLVIDIHTRLNCEGDILLLVHFRRLFNGAFVIRSCINHVSTACWCSESCVDPGRRTGSNGRRCKVLVRCIWEVQVKHTRTCRFAASVSNKGGNGDGITSENPGGWRDLEGGDLEIW